MGGIESDPTDQSAPSSGAIAWGAANRRALAELGAVAAVLLITVLAAALFGSHGGSWALNHQGVFTPQQRAALASRTVFVATTGGIMALRASDGAIRWRAAAPAPRDVAAGDGLYFVSLEGGTIKALQGSDGKPIWSAALSAGGTARLTAGSGTLYVATTLNGHYYSSLDDNRWVFAIRSSDGKELWRYHADQAVITRPAVGNDVVYFGTADFGVAALDAKTGKLLWRTPPPPASAGNPADGYTGGHHLEGYSRERLLSEEIAAAGDYVVVNQKIEHLSDVGKPSYIEPSIGTYQARDGEGVMGSGLLATQSSDSYPPSVVDTYDFVEGGASIWSSPTVPGRTSGGWQHRTDALMSGPIVADGVVYATSQKGTVYALRSRDGSELWRTTTQTYPSNIGRLPRPAALNDAVFISAGNSLYALLAPDGAHVWQFAVASPDSILFEPIIG